MIALSACTEKIYHCPYCLNCCSNNRIAFQGIHWGILAECLLCKHQFFFDVPVGHAGYDAYTVDLQNGAIFGPKTGSVSWFAKPLRDSLLQPTHEKIRVTFITKQRFSSVVVINCLDYLYGHSLLKLLNVSRHMQHNPAVGVIVIVPSCLEWCVPAGVTEVWVVSISLRNTQNFYTDLENQVLAQLPRFRQVYLSKAYSHPYPVEIEDYSTIPIHDFTKIRYRVTFIWRNDRPWFFQFYLTVLLKKIGFISILLWWQRKKIIALFSRLRSKHPQVLWTVAGVGTEGSFPAWIHDERVNPKSMQAERRLCTVYAESRIVIGVHGSSMLLPTAHAGSMINLLPTDRQGNFAQDVLYNHENTFVHDPRLLSFRYRFVDVATSVRTVSLITDSLLKNLVSAKKYFLPTH